MYDFLLKAGPYGVLGLVLGLALVFCVVFFLAKPGGEISFWGIKFHKKVKLKVNKSKRPPKNLPKDWLEVLRIFTLQDKDSLPSNRFFSDINEEYGISEIKARKICSEMEQHGLLSVSATTLRLKDSALSYAVQIEK